MTDSPEGESITAQDLWKQLVYMSQDDKRAYLAGRELLVDGEWRRFDNADVWRSLGTPLLLYTNWPNGELHVPMDSKIPVRRHP